MGTQNTDTTQVNTVDNYTVFNYTEINKTISLIGATRDDTYIILTTIGACGQLDSYCGDSITDER